MDLPRQGLPYGSHVDKSGSLWIGTVDAGLYRLANIAERPTLEEILARIESRRPTSVDAAAAVRAERDARR